MLAVEPRDAERVALVGVDPVVSACLRRIPVILADAGDAGVRARLHPDAMPHDAGRNAEWHRLMDDELRHLFEAAQATLAQDLEALDPARGEIAFLASHLRAWMSAVNQARIVLAEQNGLDERDMRREDLDTDTPRDAALLQVQVLGYVLQVLVEFALEGA